MRPKVIRVVPLVSLVSMASVRSLADPDKRLGVEEEQGAGDPVRQGFTGAREQFPQPGQTLVLGDCWSGFRGCSGPFRHGGSCRFSW